MDGPKAAINVLFGVLIGMSVPIVVTLLLVRTHQLDWMEHSFIIFLCCMACAAIGAAVNLPWQERPSRRASAAIFAEPVADAFDAPVGQGFVGGHSDRQAAEVESEAPRHRREARATPRRFAISRREALRLLGLQWQANPDEIRQAYRKLAREHHPDQFASTGEEAVAAATEKFKQIKEAYELLEMEQDDADGAGAV